jgi:hypothetical protein
MAGTVLTAIKQVRKMRGGAQSQLLQASDGHAYITKCTLNPQSIYVLANEFLAAGIGDLLGLAMPDVAVIEVPDSLIAATPELRIETAGYSQPWRSGRQFGSRYIDSPRWGNSFDYLDEQSLQNVTNIDEMARALVFDKWTGNADSRQAIFTRRSRTRYEMTLIDNGYCFNAGDWSFSDLPLHGIYYRNAVYQQVSGWDSFEPALTRAEEMDIDALWQCALDIPEEWYQGNRPGLASLIDTLHQRRSRIRDLITAFRESSRHPFPNWTNRASASVSFAALSA